MLEKVRLTLSISYSDFKEWISEHIDSDSWSMAIPGSQWSWSSDVLLKPHKSEECCVLEADSISVVAWILTYSMSIKGDEHPAFFWILVISLKFKIISSFEGTFTFLGTQLIFLPSGWSICSTSDSMFNSLIWVKPLSALIPKGPKILAT